MTQPVATLFGEDTTPVKPFLKWAGGKHKILHEISRYFPHEIATYWEPFLGGGSVYFRFRSCIQRPMLSDTNKELITTYQVVKQRVEELIDRLSEHTKAHKENNSSPYQGARSYYYHVRDALVSDDPVEIAARFIYLNKTCFNGLYRENRRGHFNVPEGRYFNRKIFSDEALRAASRALHNAHLDVGDFSQVSPATSDLVYCDPPYDGCYARYQPGGFDDAAHRRLRESADSWLDAGAFVLISNSDTPFIREMYSGDYDLHEISVRHCINGKIAAQRKAQELLIVGHPR